MRTPVARRRTRTLLFGSAALLAGFLAVPAQGPRAPAPPPGLLGTAGGSRDLGGVPDTLALQAGGVRVSALPAPGYAGLYSLRLSNLGTGWKEPFLLQVPAVPPTQDVPLLVVFHKFGGSHLDVLNTTLLDEARARGWYLVSPLGATAKSFNSPVSVVHHRAVLDLVLGTYNIDRERVYGVGFSMGGGAALNFAARNLDPEGALFAALVNHTGTLALAHTYAREWDDDDSDDLLATGQNLEVPDILEYWCGGPPAASPFAYARASSLELGPGGAVDGATDLLRNLAHVPVRTWVAAAEPNGYLQEQAAALEVHATALGLDHQTVVVSGGVHAWATLDETAACDFLAAQRLALPSSGRLLADEDGPWLHLRLWQDAPGAFTPLEWALDPAANRLALTGTANLARARVELGAAGLDVERVLLAELGSADGSADRLELVGLANAPKKVLREGVPAPGAWSWDAVGRVLTLDETAPGAHLWRIEPD